MNLIFTLIVTIFLTTMTPPPPATEIAVFSSLDVYTDEALEEAAAVIERRLDALDVEYIAVSTENIGDLWMSVRVEVEPNTLTARVIDLLTQPGYLELVDVSALPRNAIYDDALIWTTGQEARLIERTIRPVDREIPEDALLNPDTERPFETVIDGTQISTAEAQIDPNTGAWLVLVELTDDASETMAEFSAAHVGEPLAIVIDGAILTMPVIQSAISSPLWVSGNFTETEAHELAAQLGSGPLPVTLEFVGYPSR